jgi:hypothetical protein
MEHYPRNEKFAKDQFADLSRIASNAYRAGHERIFGTQGRKGYLSEQDIQERDGNGNSDTSTSSAD